MIRRLLPVGLLVALPLLLSLSACTADIEEGDEGDVGDSSEALTNGSCKISRTAILNSVGGVRKQAIQRAFTWWDAKVPYSQSKYRSGYRTDCSGFVSMAWELGTSYTTANFINNSGQNHRLASYRELVPGDALVRRSGGSGHIVMFLGWNDAARSSACVIEQASTASDMQFRSRTASSLTSGGYKAIRANKFRNVGASPDAPEEDEVDDDFADEEEADTGGGATCRSDGECNPGNNGSGLSCTAGRCVPGCRSNAHCPGIKRCVSGQCR